MRGSSGSSFGSVLVTVLVGLAILVGCGALFVNKDQVIAAIAPAPTPTPVLYISDGIEIPPSVLTEIARTNNVKAYTSTDGSASKTTTGGILFLTLPTAFNADMARYNTGAAQELALRQLMSQEGDVTISYDALVPDRAAVEQMSLAGRISSTRSGTSGGVPGEVAMYTMADIAKYAMDKQAEVSTHGMDKIAEVAESADLASMATAVMSNATLMCFGLVIMVLIVLVIYLFIKGGQKK